MPASIAIPMTSVQARSSSSEARVNRASSQVEPVMPTVLPTTRPEDDAQRDRVAQRPGDPRPASQRDARGEEGEDRHRDTGGRWVGPGARSARRGRRLDLRVAGR
ncbi:hypothetical protein CISG_10379 [Coccidioides immitis RMSCC 3703]|uniref:Uncharacterized protein n=1 Tax=Coccidioides immitis RMSCC 3703 TaxID=454286 RepID=A0A0J8QVE9_COCIT|nr:hypothetical protein CISG_10379 [Coccidioides immitis RMSCC 3703]